MRRKFHVRFWSGGEGSNALAYHTYEDLKIAGLVKNHRLAKSISDASWGWFLSSRPLLWAGAWYSHHPRLLRDSPRRIAAAVASG